jgi:hypothetical protein
MAAFGGGRPHLGAPPAIEHELVANLAYLSFIDTRSDSDTSLSSSDLGRIEHELSHLLSLKCKTLARDPPAQTRDGDEEPFIKIGTGACGTIIAQPSQPFVVKLSKANQQEALWNDYVRHAKLAKCFGMYEFDDVSIPACHYFVPPRTPTFFQHQPGIRDAARQFFNVDTSLLVTERILPLPGRVQALLIEKYCPEHIRHAAHVDPANQDCLVRVYLGSMEGRTAQQRFFSLRNFKMHLNHMVELQLDIRALARGMGMAYALMHWAAETDGRDVEFVLGSSSSVVSLARDAGKLAMVKPLTYTGPWSGRHQDLFRTVESTKLWILDFNQVRTITMDDDGVAQAVEAARVNDPYIPKPLKDSLHEREAWKAFALRYLEAADVILNGEDNDICELPLKFIKGLVQMERERQILAQQPELCEI